MKLNQPYYIDRRSGDAHLDLSGRWELLYTDEPIDEPSAAEWKYETTLPKSLYFSLSEAGVLPHPYKGVNSREYHWVDEKIWYYRRRFTLERRGFDGCAFLSFEGVSYYSRLWINGTLLGEHEGMFGGPIVDVRDYLNFNGENEIIVEVKAANYGKKESFDLRGDDPTPEIAPWSAIRDPLSGQRQFIAMGIYGGIRLDFTERMHISRPYLYTESIEGELATLKLEFEIADGAVRELRSYGISAETTCVSTNLYQQGFTGAVLDDKVEIRLTLKEEGTGKVVFESSDEQALVDHDGLVLRDMRFKEFAFFTKTIRVERPKLWQPVGLGEPNLYELEIEMLHDGKLCDKQTVTTGIRTFTAKRTAGQKYRTRWNDFSFSVNGRAIFLKGMNWMPVDYLLNLDPKEYRWALTLAKNAGIQLLRVWSGGGIFETDLFYELCDKMGIMVWQDHRIANTSNTAGYDREVLESQEAYNIYRMRNHPSLVIHCGGNEFNPYHENNSATMFTITHLIKTLDPSRVYYYASPDGGSSHCYNDMDPAWYYSLFRGLPLLAESGIHSFPTYRTMRELIRREETEGVLPDMLSEEFVENYPELLHHFTEYQPDRAPRLLARISQIGDISKMSLADICEAGQIQAYEFYLLMVQAMRSNYPVCGGVMPWAFKRPWSTVGVQLVDGDGRPTYPYYAVKSAFAPTDIALECGFSVIAPGERIPITARIFNDDGRNLDGGEINVTVYTPELKIAAEHTVEITGRKKEFELREFVPDESYTDRCFLISADLRHEGRLLARSVYFKKCTSILADAELLSLHRSRQCENLTFKNGPWLMDDLKGAAVGSIKLTPIRRGVTGGYVYFDIRVENNSEAPVFPVSFEIANASARFYATDNFFLMKPYEYKEVRLVADGISQDEAARIEASARNAERAVIEFA